MKKKSYPTLRSGSPGMRPKMGPMMTKKGMMGYQAGGEIDEDLLRKFPGIYAPATPAAQPRQPGYIEDALQNVQSAYQQGGVGSAAGQALRSAAGAMMIPTAGIVRALEPVNQAVNQFGEGAKRFATTLATGEVDPLQAPVAPTRPAVNPAARVVPAPAAQTLRADMPTEESAQAMALQLAEQGRPVAIRGPAPAAGIGIRPRSVATQALPVRAPSAGLETAPAVASAPDAVPGVPGRNPDEVEVIRAMSRSIFDPVTGQERRYGAPRLIVDPVTGLKRTPVDIPPGLSPAVVAAIRAAARGIGIPKNITQEAVQQQGAGERNVATIAGENARNTATIAGADRRNAASLSAPPAELRTMEGILKNPEMRALAKELKGDRSGRTTFDDGDIAAMYRDASKLHASGMGDAPGTFAEYKARVLAGQGATPPAGKEGQVWKSFDGKTKREFKNGQWGPPTPIKGMALGGLIGEEEDPNAVDISQPGIQNDTNRGLQWGPAGTGSLASDFERPPKWNVKPLGPQKMMSPIDQAQFRLKWAMRPGWAPTGLGTASLGYAKGGIPSLEHPPGRMIHGPGTGTSDSIPARVNGKEEIAVSDQEYILPAKVVKKAGVKRIEAFIAEVLGNG